MAADYLDWLSDVFEEAQVPFNAETADFLDQTLHKIARVPYPQQREDEVFNALRERFLKVGPSGRQLLAAYLRDAFFARRTSPHRPTEGGAHFTNEAFKG
jgi:hypothetical protein